MSHHDLDALFEQRSTFPDLIAKERFDALVGLDDHKKRLLSVLRVQLHPDGLREWASRFHPGSDLVTDIILRRPPLVVLSGDVGTGKTELASTVGDAVARQENVGITLFPLSLSARGQGKVGEMTSLISAAFTATHAEGAKLASRSGKARGGVILLVDEADAIAQSRESTQMHHEDRAGVNAFIRGVDRIATAHIPAAVILCTNRLNVLDPAVRRRAADVLTFERPNVEQRRMLLGSALGQLGLKTRDIEHIVKVTGGNGKARVGFTFSDLTQRLLPAIVLDAYPDCAVDGERAKAISETISPTPPFSDTGM